MTEPKKQDGTMELDVGQIDLLDLPLPPRSKPALDTEEVRGSKGPPPLPLPGAGAPMSPAEEEPPVPSLALPQSHPEPSQPSAPSAAISARKLAFGPPAKQKSPAVQLMIGMGGATVLCVVAFFAWKSTHKTPAAPAPAASASATAAPTHAFTMAPIEFTASSSSSASPEESAAPSAHASATPATTTTTTKPGATATTRATATAPAGTGKPPRTDELIKVEN